MTTHISPAAVLAPDDVTFVTGQLQPYLRNLLAREQAAWNERAGLSWTDLPATLAAYLDGGKALRPRFCYWGHAIAGEDTSPLLVQACAALELLLVDRKPVLAIARDLEVSPRTIYNWFAEPATRTTDFFATSKPSCASTSSVMLRASIGRPL